MAIEMRDADWPTGSNGGRRPVDTYVELAERLAVGGTIRMTPDAGLSPERLQARVRTAMTARGIPVTTRIHDGAVYVRIRYT